MSIVPEYNIRDTYNINKWYCDALYAELNLFTVLFLSLEYDRLIDFLAIYLLFFAL